MLAIEILDKLNYNPIFFDFLCFIFFNSHMNINKIENI